jgi:two-component system cell cycle sensor histidine kinase/response regulator CckA
MNSSSTCALDKLLLPQAVIDLLPVAIYVCSAPSAHIVQFNRTAAEMWGREPVLNCDSDRYCGSFKVLTRDGIHVPHEKIPMAWVLQTGMPVRGFEGIVERPDGSRIRVVVNIDPIHDASGRTIGAINVFQDITKRVEAEEALRSTETQLRQFMDSGLFGVVYWAMDAQGGYIAGANDVFVAMTGYTREEMQSGAVRWAKISRPSSEDPVRDAVAQLLSDGVHIHERELIAKDGRRLPVLLRGQMLDHETRSGMSLVLDLSELHAMREKNQLLQSQLFQTQKMEAVGQLAGAMAHDFNNLLMAISTQAELLLETSDPSKIEKRARQILVSTDNAGRLTKKLLAFSRRQELASSTFDLNDLLLNTTDLVKHVLARGVEMNTKISPVPCWIRADRTQIEQVMINLVLNARDAMPEGGKLVLSTSNVTVDDIDLGQHGSVPAGSYSLLTIADTGRGIPTQYLERIFEPFFTTKSKGSGTGLGLAIAYGIITQTGGHIRVNSTPGSGTTFSIYIPSVRSPQADSPGTRSCPLGRSNVSCPREGTALVVDDEELVRTSVRAFLETYGLTVVDTGDATEAAKIGQELKAGMSLLITDVVMPRMTGTELARLLTSDRPRLPIIFMSGYAAGEGGHERFDRATFLQKPFTRASLLDAVCEGLATCPRLDASNHNC